jgi:hypothetical protein
MKAPINFAQKVNGYKFETNGIEYSLGNDGDMNNSLWIYPQTPNARNVINIHFDWSKERYVVNVVRSGDGINYHTTLKAFSFIQTHHFETFDNFILWLYHKLPTLEHHFEIR